MPNDVRYVAFDLEVDRQGPSEFFSDGVISGARSGGPRYTGVNEDNGVGIRFSGSTTRQRLSSLLGYTYEGIRSLPAQDYVGNALDFNAAIVGASVAFSDDGVAIRAAGDAVVFAVGQDGRVFVLNDTQGAGGQAVANFIQPGSPGTGDIERTYSWADIEAQVGPNPRIVTASDGLYGRLDGAAEIQPYLEELIRSNGLNVSDPNFSASFQKAAYGGAAFEGKPDDIIIMSAQHQPGETLVLHAFDGVGAGERQSAEVADMARAYALDAVVGNGPAPQRIQTSAYRRSGGMIAGAIEAFEAKVAAVGDAISGFGRPPAELSPGWERHHSSLERGPVARLEVTDTFPHATAAQDWAERQGLAVRAINKGDQVYLYTDIGDTAAQQATNTAINRRAVLDASGLTFSEMLQRSRVERVPTNRGESIMFRGGDLQTLKLAFDDLGIDTVVELPESDFGRGDFALRVRSADTTRVDRILADASDVVRTGATNTARIAAAGWQRHTSEAFGGEVARLDVTSYVRNAEHAQSWADSQGLNVKVATKDGRVYLYANPTDTITQGNISSVLGIENGTQMQMPQQQQQFQHQPTEEQRLAQDGQRRGASAAEASPPPAAPIAEMADNTTDAARTTTRLEQTAELVRTVTLSDLRELAEAARLLRAGKIGSALSKGAVVGAVLTAGGVGLTMWANDLNERIADGLLEAGELTPEQHAEYLETFRPIYAQMEVLAADPTPFALITTPAVEYEAYRAFREFSDRHQLSPEVHEMLNPSMIASTARSEQYANFAYNTLLETDRRDVPEPLLELYDLAQRREVAENRYFNHTSNQWHDNRYNAFSHYRETDDRLESQRDDQVRAYQKEFFSMVSDDRETARQLVEMIPTNRLVGMIQDIPVQEYENLPPLVQNYFDAVAARTEAADELRELGHNRTHDRDLANARNVARAELGAANRDMNAALRALRNDPDALVEFALDVFEQRYGIEPPSPVEAIGQYLSSFEIVGKRNYTSSELDSETVQKVQAFIDADRDGVINQEELQAARAAYEANPEDVSMQIVGDMTASQDIQRG